MLTGTAPTSSRVGSFSPPLAQLARQPRTKSLILAILGILSQRLAAVAAISVRWVKDPPAIRTQSFQGISHTLICLHDPCHPFHLRQEQIPQSQHQCCTRYDQEPIGYYRLIRGLRCYLDRRKNRSSEQRPSCQRRQNRDNQHDPRHPPHSPSFPHRPLGQAHIIRITFSFGTHVTPDTRIANSLISILIPTQWCPAACW